MMSSWIILCIAADKKFALQNFVPFREAGIHQEKLKPVHEIIDISPKNVISGKSLKTDEMRKNQK
jgi:hypothetical protein